MLLLPFAAWFGEKAKLFGFNTWSEYRLQNRMAKGPSNVTSMYKDLIPKLQEAANKENEKPQASIQYNSYSTSCNGSYRINKLCWYSLGSW